MIIGPTVFSILVWGGITLVLVVFLYEIYTILSDTGIIVKILKNN